jgi:threonine dehydratase
MEVTLEEIERASVRIQGVAVRTPLLRTIVLDDRSPLWLKPENLQPMGAFKIRGAVNKIAALSQAERDAGIVTHSSGNHAQAVAYAARCHGAQAVIVMPDTAAAVKVESTRRLGAEIVFVPPSRREERCAELARDHGYTSVPPYDDRFVIAGQGTIGIEIADDLADVATVLVPVGGGGLISGVATAVKERSPSVRVIGVEPELAADAAQSVQRGRRVAWRPEQTGRTIADGLRTECVGHLPWQHIQRYVDDIVTVTEHQIRQAVRVLAGRGHLVAEPSGAVATAAYLACAESLPPQGHTVAVVSGGNIDPDRFRDILDGPD